MPPEPESLLMALNVFVGKTPNFSHEKADSLSCANKLADRESG